MEWTRYKSSSGISFEYPRGWVVRELLDSAVMVGRPDQEAFVLFEIFPNGSPASPLDVVKQLLFPAASLFASAEVMAAEPGPDNTAFANIKYVSAAGKPARANLLFFSVGKWAFLEAMATTEALVEEAGEVEVRIMQSVDPGKGPGALAPPPAPVPQAPSAQAMEPLPPLNSNPTASGTAATIAGNFSFPGYPAATAGAHQPASPWARRVPHSQTPPPLPRTVAQAGTVSAPPTGAVNLAPVVAMIGQSTPAAGPAHPVTLPPLPGSPTSLTFTRFIEPQFKCFTADVPAGWQVRGGLAHPQVGDRRSWLEAISSDGIYIFSDPEFPQTLCHVRMQFQGHYVQQAAGGSFLNLKPSAEIAADFYLKNILAKRFPGIQAMASRPRPDIVGIIKTALADMGVKLPKRAQTTAVQRNFHFTHKGQAKSGSIYSMAYFSGEYFMWTQGWWSSTIYLIISPPQLAARGEQAMLRMYGSYRNTPQMMEIDRHDTAAINARAAAANAAQWNQFAAMQAQHNAQVAFGDQIMSNYWQTQQANDSTLRGWEHTQDVNASLSQARSDEMLDRQRLADDAAGKEYDVASGSQYYWLNQVTGEVIGTDTSNPPDYANNYTLLRKL